ncbi:MAG: hypothetical protein ACXVA9_10300, partial [Bdellovibrionales bacterium]
TAFQREDAHRIYSIYRDIENRRYQSEDVRGMLNFLAVPPEKEVAVISAFVKILESGEACVDDKPSKSWVEILNILRPLAY